MATTGTFLLTHLREDTATTHVFRDIAALHAWLSTAVSAESGAAASVAPPAADPDAAAAGPPLLIRAVFPSTRVVSDTLDQKLHVLCPEDQTVIREFQTSFLETSVLSSEKATVDDGVIVKAVYFASLQQQAVLQKYTTTCLENTICLPQRGLCIQPNVAPDLQTLLRAHPFGSLCSNSEFAFYDRDACRLPWERIAVSIYCDLQNQTVRDTTLCDWMTWLLQEKPSTSDVSIADALACLETDIARLPSSLAVPMHAACLNQTFRSGVILQKVPVAVSSLRAANFEDHIGALVSTTA